METFREALGRIPADQERAVAEACGVRRTTLRSWRDRDYVPAEYWLRLRDALRAHRVVINPTMMARWAQATGERRAQAREVSG